jgi:uncharacterized membrane protein YccC
MEGTSMDQRRVLRIIASAMAALEIVMVFTTEFWPAALLMAGAFAFCAWRLGSTRRARGVLVGLLIVFLLELVPLPFYPREGLSDWIPQGLTGLLSLMGLVLVVSLLRPRRSTVTA